MMMIYPMAILVQYYRRLSEREEELSLRNEALSEREEAARRATEEAQGVRKEIERCLVFGVTTM